jgi:hypothetical protein
MHKTNPRTPGRQTIGPATLGRNSAPLKGCGAAPVQLCLARGLVTPSSEVPPHSRDGRPLERDYASLGGWTPPLARGPASIESRAPPRASFRLARGGHGPVSSIPAPPAGAFNALTSTGESTPLHAWESSGTTPPTPRHCATVCGMVSNHPAALYHPLLYGRRNAPSEKDGGTLEGKTQDYPAPARDSAVTSGQWERSPPSPSVLCDHPRHRNAIPATASPYPTLWRHAVTGHCHASHCATYGLMSTASSSPHADGPRTSNLYATTLQVTPGRAQDTP